MRTWKRTNAVVRTLTVLAVLGLACMSSRSEAGRGDDPLVGFHYQVELDGNVLGFFTSCRGMGSSQDVVEHKVIGEGGVEIIRKIPGRLTVSDVICTRGITSSQNLWEWRRQVETGNVDEARGAVTITMFDQELTPLVAWTLLEAWPAEVQAVGAGDTAVEWVRLVFEAYERTDP